ncbi:MAG TPA: hypothetical protein VG714_07765 [Acidobacteriaceae bacterium]|nr:hypothetical protein [Acidobacteriaceae bacterium]
MTEDSVPKPFVRKTGLSPKEQKLQALREKLANAKGGKQAHGASASGFSAKGNVARKTAFQRKAT